MAGAPFVGRQRELALLTARLDAAGRGRGGLVLLAGEPGIGKTRLLGELAERARAQRFLVIAGRAYDIEGMPPYLPFVEALSGYVRACPSETLRAHLSDTAADLALILPEVRRRFADLAATPAADADRYRLFESVTAFVLAIADLSPDPSPRRGGEPDSPLVQAAQPPLGEAPPSLPGVPGAAPPSGGGWGTARVPQVEETGAGGLGLLLILDDLHWADTPTLLLLRHLARRLPVSRVLVAAAYRTGELGRGHPLAETLAELRRDDLSERLLVGPLPPEEASPLIEGVAGAAPSPAVVEAVHRETEGNPFFMGEVVRHLLAEGRDLADPDAAVAGWGIPEGVREVIGRRLSRLSPEANRLLQTAAVLGDGFDFTVLEAMAGLEYDPLVDALDETLGAGMLREEGDGYHFGHALIRRTLYDELSLPRRQRLHRAAADAIETAYARNLGPHVAALAGHLRLAGGAVEQDKVLDYARQAAEAAIAVFAWEDAAAHLQAALELATPSNAAIRCDLLLALGHALNNGGEPRRTVDVVAPEALRMAEAIGDDERASQACQIALDGMYRMGAFPMAAANPDHRRWVEQADRYAAPGTTNRVHADLALGAVRLHAGHTGDAWDISSRALVLAQELDEPEVLFRAAFSIFVQSWAPQHAEAVCRLAAEMAERPRTGVRPATLGLFLGPAGQWLLDGGDRARAEALWREAEALVARTQDAYLQLTPPILGSCFNTVDGHLEAAVEQGAQILRRADELGTGRMGPSLAYQVRMRPLIHLGREEEDLPAIVWPPARMLCLAHRGRKAEAQEAWGALLQQRSSGFDADEAPHDSLVALLEAAVLVEDRDTVAALARILQPAASLTTAGFALTCIARHLGAAAALLGDHAAARAYYEQALAVCAKIRFRPEIALTHLQLAELFLAHEPEQRPAALDHLDVAVAELQEMGMRPALERALALRDRFDPRSRRATAPIYPDGLSAREVEVLRLIADGRTNQEIAGTLVLSVRTVENHTASIYAKIGARGRVEAAAYATRHGLVGP